MHDKICCLRIDVDTKAGLKAGVPEILKTLARQSAKASFFLTTGPDDFAVSALRVFREKDFLEKIITLKSSYINLASGNQSSGLRKTAESILSDGHEIGLHGYSHFRWIAFFNTEKSKFFFKRMLQGIDEFISSTGFSPSFSGAPGWKASVELLRMQDSLGFEFASDVRANAPFYPLTENGTRLKTLQIPVTLPTLDECLVSKISINPAFKDGDVYCAHAELEGIKYKYFFEKILRKNKNAGISFLPLSSLKERGKGEYRKIRTSSVPGRNNPLSVA
ncbi:polysaccharide deacetylase family protein [candidate division WOR-3 bacterium]|nr:polysaccharide deacetylase family protein [candidate division WOR-3 bacterium]